MAKKFGFDNAIVADMKAAANDSFADNIKMLTLSELHSSTDNFYDVSDVNELADDIERQGLKTPIYVISDNSGYKIISGHRRYNAVQKLVTEGRYTAKTIPCYIGTSKGEAEDMLDMIMLNATSRVISDADMLTQYRELERIYNVMEAEGKKIKGRMREKIATALQVSPAQVGKIENIIHNAVPEVAEAVEQGGMSISTANEVAKLKPEKQKELISQKAPEKISHKEVKSLSEKKKEPKQLVMSEADSNDELAEEFPVESYVPDDMEEYDKDFLKQQKTLYPDEYTLTSEETCALAQSLNILLEALMQTNPHNFVVLRELERKIKNSATYSTIS